MAAIFADDSKVNFLENYDIFIQILVTITWNVFTDICA